MGMMKEKKVNGKPERKEKLLESILHCSGDDNGSGGGELERVKFKGKTRHTMYYRYSLGGHRKYAAQRSGALCNAGKKGASANERNELMR